MGNFHLETNEKLQTVNIYIYTAKKKKNSIYIGTHPGAFLFM